MLAQRDGLSVSTPFRSGKEKRQWQLNLARRVTHHAPVLVEICERRGLFCVDGFPQPHDFATTNNVAIAARGRHPNYFLRQVSCKENPTAHGLQEAVDSA